MKRVLIIAYYFNDENMGAIRLRRIAKYLPRLGYEPTILTALPETIVVKEIAGVRIERVKALDLKAVYERIKGRKEAEVVRGSEPGALPKSKNTKLTAWLNRWLMIPDKQIPWLWPAVRRGRELLSAEPYDLIFASLEPRTNLLVAAKLAKFSGLPCVMEYRDLWNNNPYHHQQQPSAFHKWLHGCLERYVLSRATCLSTVCRGIQTYLQMMRTSNVSREVGLVYNFYDPDEYPDEQKLSAEKKTFTVIYTGAMYFSRNPYAFFKGFRLFLDKYALPPEAIQFKWMGVTAALPELEQALKELQLVQYLDFQGIVDHEAALSALCSADAALILQSPEDAIHIPGKLYEALGARVPVLALSKPCEVTEIIDRVHGGIHVPHEPKAVCRALQELWQLHQDGRVWAYNEAEVEKFSAGQMVGRLARLFEQVCS